MKKIAIIGSTGSIGQNTLRVLRAHPGKFQVVALAAKQDVKQLLRQALEFKPKLVCIYNERRGKWLSNKLKGAKIRVVTGDEGLVQASTYPTAQQVIFSVVGAVGLRPIFEAVKCGKHIAVANKEPLVMAGELLVKLVKQKKVDFIPIDSEHSGLWQCLEGRNPQTIRKLVLTSSGGPFLNRKGSLDHVQIDEALNHPRWKMGPKITIDSATLMNKGLEVIEAANLFETSINQIDVVVHPEAVIHALIEFIDGSQLAQLGITDMRLPIQYALSYPTRLDNTLPSLELTKLKHIQFMQPNRKKFPCLELGYEAKREGGTMPAVLNAANEIAVQKFLNGEISFTRIPKMIAKTMNGHRVIPKPVLHDIFEADRWARERARTL